MPRLRHTLVACLLAASTATMADNAADNTLPLVARASGALYLRAVFGRDIESDLLVPGEVPSSAFACRTCSSIPDRATSR